MAWLMAKNIKINDIRLTPGKSVEITYVGNWFSVVLMKETQENFKKSQATSKSKILSHFLTNHNHKLKRKVREQRALFDFWKFFLCCAKNSSFEEAANPYFRKSHQIKARAFKNLKWTKKKKKKLKSESESQRR